MDGSKQKYFIKYNNKTFVEVSKEVYTVYYQMERQERYQKEKDFKHGLLYYDSWDTENTNGMDYIKDAVCNIEEIAMRNMMCLYILKFIDEYDKQKILKYTILGKTEREIAQLLGISKSSVNRMKQKLLKALKEYFNKNFDKN